MILTFLKTIPLIILAFLLLPHIKHENFTPFFTGNTSDFLRTVIIVYWCFTGFEISAIPADETKNKNDIFRSLVIVMLVVTFVYLFLNISLIGSLGSRLIASSPAPMAEAASIAFASSGNIMAYIGIIAMMSALNAYLLATSRVLQNLSFNHNLPFVPDIGKNGTPYAAIMISTFAGASLLLFSNHFEQLATISVITTLLPYLFICASALKMFDSFKIRIISILGFFQHWQSLQRPFCEFKNTLKLLQSIYILPVSSHSCFFLDNLNPRTYRQGKALLFLFHKVILFFCNPFHIPAQYPYPFEDATI